MGGSNLSCDGISVRSLVQGSENRLNGGYFFFGLSGQDL